MPSKLSQLIFGLSSAPAYLVHASGGGEGHKFIFFYICCKNNENCPAKHYVRNYLRGMDKISTVCEASWRRQPNTVCWQNTRTVETKTAAKCHCRWDYRHHTAKTLDPATELKAQKM